MPEEPDFERMLEVLEKHRVRYLVVGGVGAQIYGASRRTLDADYLVERSKENLERIGAALRELGAYLRVAGLSDEEARRLPVQTTATALDNMGTSTWCTDAGDLDVLMDIPNETGARMHYEDLAERAQTADVGRIVVPVASLPDIIASKEFANRAKDHEALPELREIAGRLALGSDERQVKSDEQDPPH